MVCAVRFAHAQNMTGPDLCFIRIGRPPWRPIKRIIMKIFHVDAFTNELFKGNTAGVVIIENNDIDKSYKQKIAFELNHPETAFVTIGNGTYSIQWFSPKREVDICGHATLAAAHVLWENGINSKKENIIFNSNSGDLLIKYDNGRICMNFPQLFVGECAINKEVIDSLGILPIYMARNEKRYLIEIEKEIDLRNMNPNMNTLISCDRLGYMVTCRSESCKYDFLSRFFAPSIGINEDPVTGSSHCYLAPYWGKKLNINKMIGFQASERTGVVECELIEGNRVILMGYAKTFYSAEIKHL